MLKRNWYSVNHLLTGCGKYPSCLKLNPVTFRTYQNECNNKRFKHSHNLCESMTIINGAVKRYRTMSETEASYLF